MNPASFQSSDEIDITPMLDVVFILLIFFIVTSTFVREAGVNIFVPDNDSMTKSNLPPVIVAVNAGGQVEIDRRPVSVHAVNASIRILRATKPGRSVAVKVQRKVKLKSLITVIDGIRLAGINLPPIELVD